MITSNRDAALPTGAPVVTPAIDLVWPQDGMSIHQYLLTLPYARDELNGLMALPYMTWGTELGYDEKTFDYSTHWPQICALIRHKLATALMNQMLKVHPEIQADPAFEKSYWSDGLPPSM